jgi:hypothetical protein
MVEVLPHFDAFAARMPDVILNRMTNAPAGVTVLGIDEDTALIGDSVEPGSTWQVHGRQSVWVLRPDGRREIPTGSTLVLN